MKKVAALVACAFVAGCATPETSAPCAGLVLESRLSVLESDLRTTSGLGAIGRDGCLSEVAGGLALSGDTALSASAGRVFVLDRAAGLVHEIDPGGLRIARTQRAFASGEDRSNPQFAAVDAGGRLWVTRFDLPTLAILSGDELATVDLGAFADADGLPEMAAIQIAGGRAYVALELLDRNSQEARYPPTGPGMVLSIAIEDPSDVRSIELAGRNPFGRFSAMPGDPALIAVATPGSFEAVSPEDGIDIVDTAADAARQAVSEAALGGSATEVALVGPDEGYAIVAGPEEGVNPTRVVAFNPETGEVTRTLAQANGYYHWGLAIAGRYLVVGDRTPGEAGIQFFERGTRARAGALTVQQMAPVSIVALEG